MYQISRAELPSRESYEEAALVTARRWRSTKGSLSGTAHLAGTPSVWGGDARDEPLRFEGAEKATEKRAVRSSIQANLRIDAGASPDAALQHACPYKDRYTYVETPARLYDEPVCIRGQTHMHLKVSISTRPPHRHDVENTTKNVQPLPFYVSIRADTSIHGGAPPDRRMYIRSL